MLIVFLWPTGTYPFEADLVVPRTFAQRHGPRRQWTNSERTLRLSGRLANSLETDVDGCGRMRTVWRWMGVGSSKNWAIFSII